MPSSLSMQSRWEVIQHLAPHYQQAPRAENRSVAGVDHFAKELDILQEVLNELPGFEAIREAEEARIDLQTPVAQQAQQAALRVLSHFFDTIDPAHWWQGLSQVITPDGMILWLCEEHQKEFESPLLGKR